MPAPHYSHLADPLIRDLAWLLDEGQDLAVELAPFASIRKLALPSPTLETLQRWLTQTPEARDLYSNISRLGKQLESLIEIWLAIVVGSHGEVLRNIQLRDPTSGSTSGELDFSYLFSGLRHHLEVSVKFYAGVESAGQWHWLGENPRDSLEGKCEHLRLRQLPRSLHLPWITGVRSYWLKGRLFEPVTESPGLMPVTTGGWCHAHQLPMAAERWPGLYAALPYSRWLGGLELSEARQQARPLADWQQHVGGLTRSLMLSSVEHHSADRWRIWILPEHWPQATNAR